MSNPNTEDGSVLLLSYCTTMTAGQRALTLLVPFETFRQRLRTRPVCLSRVPISTSALGLGLGVSPCDVRDDGKGLFCFITVLYCTVLGVFTSTFFVLAFPCWRLGFSYIHPPPGTGCEDGRKEGRDEGMDGVAW